MTNRSFRIASFLVLLSVVLVACGQKKGVHGAGAGFVRLPDGTVVDPADPSQPIGGTSGPVPSGGVTTGPLPSGGATTGPPPPVTGGNRTGISPKEIIIGIHAPATGAAPVSADAFKAGKDLYWNWLTFKGKSVYGRKVSVLFADDQYKPTTAVSVCNQMATQGKAFLLIGGAGSDQINACANFADQRTIPYLSPGVQEAGLNVRRSYFAVTMTYKQQMQPLVQLLKKENAGNKLNKYGTAALKLGFIRPNTPNFDDSAAALKSAALAAGFEYKVYSVVKEGNSTEASTVATQMQQDGVDVAIPITAPTFTTQLAINTGKNGYKPLYAGVAISNNINQEIDLTCKNGEFEKALFLSPWPGWKQVMAGQYDADFAKAAQKFAPNFNKRNKGGDILMALWGIMKAVHQMFVAAGPTMSRESFIQTMNSFSLKTKMFPDLAYSSTNHFGAQNVHVLEGRCDEPGDGENNVGAGAQFVTHPRYPGLYSSF